MADINRLRKFYPFDHDLTLEPIAEAAKRQNKLSFIDLADRYDVDNASVRTSVGGKAIEYLHLRQTAEPANDSTYLLFAPMGNGALNQNIIMRALRLYEAARPAHLIVAAGPAHLRNKANLLGRAERKQVARGDLTPTVTPILRELGRLGLNNIDALGYSLGASMAQAAAIAAPDRDISVGRGVWAESTNIKKRRLPKLAKDFFGAGYEFKEYVKACDSPPLVEAHELAEDTFNYFLGLARPSNVAIAKALSRPTYGPQLVELLDKRPQLDVTTVIAGDSNISGYAVLGNIPLVQGREIGLNGHLMVLCAATHSAADDIDLHAAMMIEGLSKAQH